MSFSLRIGFAHLLWVLSLASATSAVAQLPEQLTYTGFLETPDGSPYDGLADVQVAFFDQPVEGREVWSELHEDLDVIRGWLAVQLGSEVPFDFDWSVETQLWVELSVNGEALLPRQPVDPVPFANVTGHALEAEAAVGGLAGTLADIDRRISALESATIEVAWGDVTGKPATLEDGDVAWSEVIGKPSALDDDVVGWGEIAGRPAALDDGEVNWTDVSDRPTALDDGVQLADITDLATGLAADFTTGGVEWTSIDTRPDGLDDGDDVGLTSVALADITDLATGLAADFTTGGVEWTSIDTRPDGLDDGDDVGLTSVALADITDLSDLMEIDLADGGIQWTNIDGTPPWLEDDTVNWDDIPDVPEDIADGDFSVDETLVDDWVANNNFAVNGQAVDLYDCTRYPSSGWLNPYDGELNSMCPPDQVEVGLHSIHDNGVEDRQFAYYCCKARI